MRAAGPADAQAVARLLTELGYPASEDEARARLAALGDADRVLLTGDGDGLIALHRIPRLAEGGAFARITALVVSAGTRGSGQARALLAAAEQVARAWGCAMLEVSSGRRAERDAAHGLYRAAGYTDTADVSVRYRKGL